MHEGLLEAFKRKRAEMVSRVVLADRMKLYEMENVVMDEGLGRRYTASYYRKKGLSVMDSEAQREHHDGFGL